MSAIKPVTAAGGVLFKENHSSCPLVVLIYRRGVWDLPKGKLEEDESISECAVREVAEETGLSTHPVIAGKFAHRTYHEYERQEIRYGKTTRWFAMKLAEKAGEENFEPQVQEDIKKVRWVPLQQATEQVGYDNLVEVLVSFRSWYKSSFDSLSPKE